MWFWLDAMHVKWNEYKINGIWFFSSRVFFRLQFGWWLNGFRLCSVRMSLVIGLFDPIKSDLVANVWVYFHRNAIVIYCLFEIQYQRRRQTYLIYCNSNCNKQSCSFSVFLVIWAAILYDLIVANGVFLCK